jgi:hypothetical protein
MIHSDHISTLNIKIKPLLQRFFIAQNLTAFDRHIRTVKPFDLQLTLPI